jgi:SAM-dependent methyltransferase
MSLNNLQTANISYHEAQDHMKYLPNYYRWIFTYARPFVKGTVMELGCGRGLLIPYYIKQVNRIVAVDHNEMLLKKLQQIFAGQNLQTVRLDLRRQWGSLEGFTVDTIIALDLLEHFQNDQLLVKKMKTKMNPGGFIFIKVPAQRHLYSEMDRASGHYRRYDPDDLRQLAESEGLEIVSIRYMNPLGALVYRSRNRKPTNLSKTFVRPQLKFINLCLYVVPILDRLPKFKGLSLIGVFRVP